MNINLANIDFVPGQGGGEAVIRSLDVTENGTYSAPSGVDGYSPVNVNVSGGGSLTPEEQEALDTLVNSSDGVLNTIVVESEGILGRNQNPTFSTSTWDRYLYDVDGEIYCKSDSMLYRYNPETLSFDFLFYLTQYNNTPLWKDNSGRLYEGISNQIDIENKTVTSVSLEGPYQNYENSDNIYKGKYGIYILTNSSAYKFNEETQKFEVWSGTYTTDYQGEFNYYGNVKEYDGHIIIVTYGYFYELIETENSITIKSVNPYFNTTLPNGESINSYSFYNVGDNYYYFNSSDKFRLVNNEWIKFTDDKFYYNFDWTIKLVSSNGLFILKNDSNEFDKFNLFNPGTSDYKKTIWTKILNVAVDLTSSQEVYGHKRFNNGVYIDNLETNNIRGLNNDIYIRAGQTGQTNIVLQKKGDIELNCNNLLKNNTIIPTIDDIIINKTITYPGKFMNEVTTSSPIYGVYARVWTTSSGRLFVSNFEWDFSTSNWIERSFNIDITETKSRIFTTSFGLIFIAPVNYGMIYVWNESSTNWDLLYDNPDGIGLNVDSAYYWVYGGDLYYGNNKKFDPNNLEWVSGEYCTNFSYNQSKCNIGNDVYVRDASCSVMKYNSSTKTFDRIAQNQTFSNGYLFKYNNDLYVYDNENVFKYNTSTDEFDTVDNIGVFNDNSYYNIYFEFDGQLYTVKNEKIGYLYDLNINTPAVPATDGTYTLKAVRAGDQITYNWVLDA